MKKILCFILILCLPCVLFASTVLNAISVQHTSDYTQITLQFSAQPVTHRVFALSHPDRLVIDANDTKMLRPVPESSAFENTIIHDMRAGIQNGNGLRLVIDVNQVTPYHVQYVHAKKNFQMILQFSNSSQPLPKISIVASAPKKQAAVAPAPVPIPAKKIASPKTKITMPPITKNISTPKTTVVAAPNQPNKSAQAPAESNGLFHRLLTTDENLFSRGRDIVIVVDPGHGGKDPGTTAPNGTHEKDVVFAIAKYLQADLNAQPGFKALLTRDGDYYLTLRKRLAIARADKADLFVAIHADAFKDATATGVSVFALSLQGATTEAARWLAEQENQSELMGGVQLSDEDDMLRSVIINLSQNATIRSSLEAGHDVLNEVGKVDKLHHDHQVDQASFVVLKSPDIPSLLIETGFLSNPNEEKKLTNPVYCKKMAKAITAGIVDYFQKNPPRDTKLAYKKMDS